jgi:hypothetical protein
MSILFKRSIKSFLPHWSLVKLRHDTYKTSARKGAFADDTTSLKFVVVITQPVVCRAHHSAEEEIEK